MESNNRRTQASTGRFAAAERPKHTTHYQVLGVDKYASITEIRIAYFRLKSVYMSGNQALYSLINEEELAATITRIEVAYDTLYSSSRRRAYDQETSISGAPDVQDLPALPITPVLQKTPTPDPDMLQLETAVNAISGNEPGLAANEIPQAKTPRIRGAAVAANDPNIRKTIDAMIASVKLVDGNFLRSLRQTVGVEEQEMQINTKIPLNFLENLENDRIDEMPQSTYAKGFVKSYLRYLGINDGKDLVDSYFQRGTSCSRPT